MQMTRSAARSRSEVIWLESSTLRWPSETKASSSSSSSSRAMGSRPAVASSKMSSLALWLSAQASCSLMPMPRERSLTFVLGSRPNRSMNPANVLRSHVGYAGPTSASIWPTLSVEGKGHVSSTRPTRARRQRCVSSGASAPQRCPNRRTSPASSFISPRAARIVVVLPAPLAPTKPTIWPGSTASVTSRSEKRSLTVREMPLSSSKFCMV